jgi:hypothetical protein
LHQFVGEEVSEEEDVPHLRMFATMLLHCVDGGGAAVYDDQERGAGEVHNRDHLYLSGVLQYRV